MGRVKGLFAALAVLALASVCGSGVAAAQEVYVGAAVGKGNLRSSVTLSEQPISPAVRNYEFDGRHTVWKVLMGVRPIPLAGAELEYLDFGHLHVDSMSGGLPLRSDARMKGAAAFAVGYLPLPIPILDVYGKLGVTVLQTRVDAVNEGHACAGFACVTPIPASGHFSRTSNDLAYGAGLRIKPAAFAVRIEYERIRRDGGDPDLFTVGVTYSY